jgi:hypothetical protein
LHGHEALVQVENNFFSFFLSFFLSFFFCAQITLYLHAHASNMTKLANPHLCSTGTLHHDVRMVGPALLNTTVPQVSHCSVQYSSVTGSQKIQS